MRTNNFSCYVTRTIHSCFLPLMKRQQPRNILYFTYFPREKVYILVSLSDNSLRDCCRQRIWLMKAFPDTARDLVEINFNKKLRSARVVSEHAYRMLKGRWRLLYKKVECNEKSIMCIGIVCAITLHKICIHVNDPCKRPWRLDVQDLNLIRGRHNGIHDKNEVRRVRQKVVDWLWSLS